MSDIKLLRWDPKARYKFGCGCGYYLDGVRRVMSKGKPVEKPVNVDRYRSIMGETTEFMVEKLGEIGETAPFVVIDDASPVTMDIDWLAEITSPHPFFYWKLPKNLGVGGKENILQYLLGQRCDYILRWDSDITLHDLDLEELVEGFETLEDAWAITSCITYFARLEAAQLPKKQNHFAGSNIADFVAYRSSVFADLGYADPDLRINEDGEMRLRALAKLGMKCYVDKRITGKAMPSGAGVDHTDRRPIGEYIAETRKFIKVVFPKNGSFRLLLNKKGAESAADFHIPPHPYAVKLASKLWK